MKISKTFVRIFLGLILASLVLTAVALALDFYNPIYLAVNAGLIVVLFLLIFRKHKVGFIRFLAWTLPILFILGVLYLNFLPFGFHKDYTITIGADGSVVSSSSQIFLQDMKGKVITNLSDVYTYGQVNVVVKPKAVLRNATVNISIINSNSSNVYLAKTNFSVENNKWDYFWDFTKGIPSPLNGTAKYDKEKGCVYFNGSLNQTLSYPNSSDMFEDGSFVVYAKWKPEDAQGKNQQIIGHFNWELWQNNNSVSSLVVLSDLNDSGDIYFRQEWPINSSFFNKSHSFFIVYDAGNYIGFILDGDIIYKSLNNTFINSKRWTTDLTFGWSPHIYGRNSYYEGCIYEAAFVYAKIKYLKNDSFNSNDKTVQVAVLGNGRPEEIKVSIRQ